MDYFNDVLTTFLGLEHIIWVASMEGWKALRFHQKYLNLCSEDERRSCEFGTTWVWVINDSLFRVVDPFKAKFPAAITPVLKYGNMIKKM